MKKFIIDRSFWELFPEATIGVMLLRGYENAEESPQELVDMLAESNRQAARYLTAENFSDNPVVQVWRQAFRKFKTKKGVRCSIEALLKRSTGENPVHTINPLVDIYNSASLRYALPVGSEDMDTFVGDLRLTITEGGDDFHLIGEEESNPSLPGELVYKDDAGAVCRCFNWRDGQRTMITGRTRNAFMIIENLEPERVDDLKALMDFVQENAEKYLHAEVKKTILDRNNPEMVIGD
ncbi:MAG: B3/4 domain-containing protein [Solobacterium sp.]|nr:B3/4 domain-containing protein [Solobacterium sp.]